MTLLLQEYDGTYLAEDNISPYFCRRYPWFWTIHVLGYKKSIIENRGSVGQIEVNVRIYFYWVLVLLVNDYKNTKDIAYNVHL